MSIAKACRQPGYARPTFFEVRQNRETRVRKDTATEAFVLEKVGQVRKEMPGLGGKKPYFLINRDPERERYRFGEKRFFGILKANGLLVKRRKKRAVTTDSSLWRRQYPDLLTGLVPSRPEQVWVSDITYFRTRGGFVYGHLITDGYSKKLMGFEVSDNMKASTALLALKMAVGNRMYEEGPGHHSDRGSNTCPKCTRTA